MRPLCYRYIYEQFLAADVNFCLKNRNRSADTVGLVTGLAYFVPDSPYQDYLSSYPAQHEVCVLVTVRVGFTT